MSKLTTPTGLKESLHIVSKSRDLKDLIVQEKFEKFRDLIRAEYSFFEELETKEQRTLFLYEFIIQGEFPKVIYAEHYLYNDSGVLEATDGVFSVKEVEVLSSVSNEVFNRFKAFGVSVIEKYLKGIKND